MPNFKFTLIPMAICVCFTTHSTAAACYVRTKCAPDASCEALTVRLDWTEESTREIILDGDSYSVRRITSDTIKAADTTWKTTTRGPAPLITEAGYSGSIRPTDQSGAIVMSIIKAPTKYVDYADARSLRRTFEGTCEGLF